MLATNFPWMTGLWSAVLWHRSNFSGKLTTKSKKKFEAPLNILRLYSFLESGNVFAYQYEIWTGLTNSLVLFCGSVGHCSKDIGRKPVRLYLFLNVFWAYHKIDVFINKVENWSEIEICEKCSVCKMRQANFEHRYLPENIN